MTEKLENDGQIENNTGTNLQILQNIEKAFYRNNPNAQRRNTARSLKWFSQYVPRSFNRVRTAQLFRDNDLWEDRIRPGSMYFAVYDPIHKDKLPYYDEFPILLPWDTWEQNGHRYLISINLHFLPPKLRFLAVQALLKVRTEKRYRASTRLKINWQILQGLSKSKHFEHCVRIYRVDHFRSKFIKVPPKAWELAIFLPVARIKGDKTKAWKI